MSFQTCPELCLQARSPCRDAVKEILRNKSLSSEADKNSAQEVDIYDLYVLQSRKTTEVKVQDGKIDPTEQEHKKQHKEVVQR